MLPTAYASLIIWTVAADPAPAYSLEIKPARHIEAELTFSQSYKNFKAKDWVVCVARPPELPGQTKLTTTMEPAARVKVVQESSDLSRALLMLSLPGKQEQGFDVKIKCQATLLSRRLISGKNANPVALGAAEEKATLAATPLGDFNAVDFQKWLDANKLRRGKSEDEIDLARRVFSAIAKNYTYNYQANQDRRASKLCMAKSADCGGMSVLFAAALRANHIPARVLAGRWAQSAKPDERVGGAPYFQAHVKAEFFAKGVGWVPVDPSSAVQYDKGGLRYFGNDPGDFLTMHVDTDLSVDTGWGGEKKSVPWMQGVKFWVRPPPADNGESKESWQVKKLDR
jgi:transglutaminase-like putative cysteine protease